MFLAILRNKIAKTLKISAQAVATLPQIQSTQIKEIEDKDDKNKDPYDLAAHTMCLDEKQCEKWLEKMHNHGINF
jgi:hypothetical protein